jgi:phosphomethylpyrimidine synthase
VQVEDVHFEQSPTIADCFPSSEKVHKIVQHGDTTIEVPFRRIHLSGGSGHLDVQDTSGPQV